MGLVKFAKASREAYREATKDDETLYFVNETGDFSDESMDESGELYLGSKKISSDNIPNAETAEKLKTARNIKPTDAVVSDGEYFDGSQDIEIPIDSLNADYVDFRTAYHDNDSGFMSSPSYMALNKAFNANRLALFNYSLVTIENSTDGGGSWVTDTYTDNIKKEFINGIRSLSLKGVVFTAGYTNQYRLRITYDFVKSGLDADIEHIMIKAACGGANTFRCKIEKAIGTASTVFTEVADGQLKGNAGWNTFDFSRDDMLVTNPSGSTTTAVNKLRFTFYVTDGTPQGEVPIIHGIEMYGGRCVSDNSIAVDGDIFGFNGNNEVVTDQVVNIDTLGNAATADNAKYADVAESLDGRIETTEAEFTFRPTSDDISITDGSAKIKTIKGNTVFFNQLLQNGNFENGTTGWKASNTTISIENYKLKIVNNAASSNSIYQSVSLPKGHKVLVTTAFKRNVSNLIRIHFLLRKKGTATYDSYYKEIASSSRQVVTCIITTTAEIDWVLFYHTYAGKGNETLVDYVALYDLTMMFGEGNEPTEEEFFKLFPNHYYPYNTGELMSLNTQSIKTVGFNQLNLMRTEMVSISSTPTTPKDFNENQIWLNTDGYGNSGRYPPNDLIVNNNSISWTSSNLSTSYWGVGFPFRVFPNTQYYVHADSLTNLRIRIGFFDYRGVNISQLSNQQNQVFTTPIDCVWCMVTFSATTNNIKVIVENPVLNLSHTGYRNGEYEVYKQEERQLPIKTYFPNGMNANDYAFDELTQTHAIQRVKVVNVEDMGWKKSDEGRFAVDDYMPFPQYPTSDRKIRCDWDYTCDPDSVADMCYNLADEGSIYVNDSSCSTLEEFITKNTGKKMIIDLDTPIETSVEEPLNFEYYVEDFGTEEALSLLQSSSPFKASIYYDFNAIDTIRTNRRNIAMLIDEVDELQSDFADLKKVVENLDNELQNIINTPVPTTRISHYNSYYNYTYPQTAMTDTFTGITFNIGGNGYTKAAVNGSLCFSYSSSDVVANKDICIYVCIQDKESYTTLRRFSNTISLSGNGYYLFSFNTFMECSADTATEYVIVFSVNKHVSDIALWGGKKGDKYEISELTVIESMI